MQKNLSNAAENGKMYKKFIRPILFKGNAESVHNSLILLGRFLAFSRISRILRKNFVFKNKILRNKVMGIYFDNPVGLAAGFDKNAYLIDFMPDIGFGFIEIGSVTAEACTGNPKPRLHRLVKDRGIIVNYGLANEGANKVRERLNKKKFRIPVGISIAKTNNPNIKGEESVNDYLKSFKIMKELGDYITINISCPNAGDGRSFEDPVLLGSLLKKINKIRNKKNILLKISPDIDKKNLDKILKLAKKYKINGFVVSNLTKKRENLSKDFNLKYPGGISGKPAKEKSNKLIKYIFKKTKGNFVIVGCGGVFNGADAYEKIKNGASLIQMITGMIFEGPGVISRINKKLVELLKKDGYNNIAEAIGKWKQKT